jgi:hypothetical protein
MSISYKIVSSCHRLEQYWRKVLPTHIAFGEASPTFQVKPCTDFVPTADLEATSVFDSAASEKSLPNYLIFYGSFLKPNRDRAFDAEYKLVGAALRSPSALELLRFRSEKDTWLYQNFSDRNDSFHFLGGIHCGLLFMELENRVIEQLVYARI